MQGGNEWMSLSADKLICFWSPSIVQVPGTKYLPCVREFGDLCLPVFWSSFVLSHSRDILCSAAVITLENHPLFTGAITCNPTPCRMCKLISPTALIQAPESLCFAVLSPLAIAADQLHYFPICALGCETSDLPAFSQGNST